MRVLLLLGLVVASTNALGGLLGGLQEVENLTEKQQEMVDFAFSQLAGSTVAGSVNCEQNKATVENFRQQVVSGMLYHFDLVLSAECAGTAKKCSMVVYDQSWTQTREVQWDKVKCENGDSSEESSEEASNENFKGKVSDDDSSSQEDSSESNESSEESKKYNESKESNESNESVENESVESSSTTEKPKFKKLLRVPLAKSRTEDIISNVLRRFQMLNKGAEEIEFNLLGGDQPKYLPHYKKGYQLIGIDGHDALPHGKILLGSGDHDKVPHGKPLLEGGDHDYVLHGKPLLGGDGHDAAPHGKPLLGGGDHDYVPHGKPLLGGDDHDLVAHNSLLGGGKPHGPKFDLIKNYAPVDATDDFMLRKLPPMEKSLKKLKELQSKKSFHSFMKINNKQYKDKAEYLKRYTIFKDNMKKVQFLQETELGTGVYGATHLADITEMEFKTNYLGVDLKKDDPDVHWPAADIPDVDLPESFDWRKHNAVTPVKNQGMCGSCWAFSVSGNVEGQYAIKNKKLVSLSEQELVDCDKRDAGCNGGLPENAYKTLLEIGGLESEADYGYDGADEKCHFNRTKVVARVQGGLEISQNETQMAQWLFKNGPISVGLNANAMQFYMGGVSHPWKFLCGADGIDHGVLIVGFGVHEYPLFHRTMPYWIIKNSWGPSWGEQGYYRLYRGDGTCGINMMTSSAVLADGQ